MRCRPVSAGSSPPSANSPTGNSTPAGARPAVRPIPATPASDRPPVLRKRSVTIRGHATSYSVEDEFQAELTRIALARGVPLARLIARIDTERAAGTNLSSAVRLFVLKQLKSG